MALDTVHYQPLNGTYGTNCCMPFSTLSATEWNVRYKLLCALQYTISHWMERTVQIAVCPSVHYRPLNGTYGTNCCMPFSTLSATEWNVRYKLLYALQYTISHWMERTVQIAACSSVHYQPLNGTYGTNCCMPFSTLSATEWNVRYKLLYTLQYTIGQWIVSHETHSRATTNL